MFVLVSLLGTNEIIYGIHNTTVGGDSTPSTVGQSRGNYLPNGEPKKACDNDTSTTYLNFGNCDEYEKMAYCGLKTGLYMTPERGTSIIVGLQFCTGNDFPDRDPIRITLEGTNEPANQLTLGSSWTLIYDGSSGLDYDPGRTTCGEKELFSNSVEYTSYRVLVTEKRGADNSVQYSELRLFGF
ncbi:unnamed protein product [Rotaria sordida]|uniref:Uncharacterized protein n=1 Tax=Rotaria sordida TaxID=392033 RepID=A0A819JAB2_9BILA|nr:unnamed protein product [Rotaria sordida]